MCSHDHVDMIEEREGADCALCAGNALGHWAVTCRDCGAGGDWCELRDAFSWEAAPSVAANPGETDEEFRERARRWLRGLGEERRLNGSFSVGFPGRKRRNAVCPTCGATDAYVSPFSNKLSCRVCERGSAPRLTLKEAFDRAEAALDRGDLREFDRWATAWAHLLYGSRERGEEAIASAIAGMGDRIEALRVMMYG